MTSTTPQDSRVANALSAESSSIRLQAALAIGSGADADYTELLVERCAIEPDFFVRDMLSWALTRLPPEIVLPRLHRELDSGCNQARSQALHTLSKIGDKSTWPWITREMLGDPDDGIAHRLAHRRRPRSAGREGVSGRGADAPARSRRPQRPAEPEPGADRPRRVRRSHPGEGCAESQSEGGCARPCHRVASAGPGERF